MTALPCMYCIGETAWTHTTPEHTEFYCKRHGDYSDNRVVSIGSGVDKNGNLLADQCGLCIDECESATW